MPELDGVEATRQICAAWPGAAVIILSMHCQTEYVVRTFRAGAKGFLVKESAGTELIEAVRKVAAGSRFLSHLISAQVLTASVHSKRLEEDDTLGHLSVRERQILAQVVEGKSSAEIAQVLRLSPKTVETYRSRMMTKLEVRNVAGLVRVALLHQAKHPGADPAARP